MSCAPSTVLYDVDLLAPSDDLTRLQPHVSPRHQRSRSYVIRRWDLFQSSDSNAPFDAVDMSAISRLPLALQVSFRIKMLSIFALQLLVVLAFVGVFRYQRDAKACAYQFFDPPVARIAIAFVSGLVLLVGLYLLRDRFPWNWLLLGLFTAAQSFCFVGLGVVLDTNIGFFNCAFSFVCVVLMMGLSGVRRRHGGGDDVVSEEDTLLSSLAAGAISYVVAALAAWGLFAVYGTEFVTREGFLATLGFQLLLILWFAYDASSMYRIMSPDEYMHGVIYFYTDLIVLALVTLAIMGTVAVVAGFRSSDDKDSGASSDGDCEGCASTLDSCCRLVAACDDCSHAHRHHHYTPPVAIQSEQISLMERGSGTMRPEVSTACSECSVNEICTKCSKLMAKAPLTNNAGPKV